MALTKESEDAFRQCLRILAPRCTPTARRQQIINVETYIKNGKWIPAFNINNIAHLFYPHDATLEIAFLRQMEKAIEAQELITIEAGGTGLFPTNLAAWPDCPAVPQNSPLRYWLPDWMRASALPAVLPIPTDGEAGLSVVPADTRPASMSAVVETATEREDRRYREFEAMGGGYTETVEGWRVTGHRGLLAKLTQKVKAAGEPMHHDKDVREGLNKAATRAKDARAAGYPGSSVFPR